MAIGLMILGVCVSMISVLVGLFTGYLSVLGALVTYATTGILFVLLGALLAAFRSHGPINRPTNQPMTQAAIPR